MIKGKAAYFILGIVFVTALILRLVQFFNKDDFSKQLVSTSTKNVSTQITSKDLEMVEPKYTLEKEMASTTLETPAFNNGLAVITEPQPNSVISSPLIVKGEAPGAWFFEASFPVKLLDNVGNIIVSAPALAQSDPLTENFLPYKTLLEFNTTATSGYLLLTNDNPSGLPENELSVKIPVLFLNK